MAEYNSDDIAGLLVHIGRTARGAGAGDDLTAAQWTALVFFERANAGSRTPSAFASFQATTRGTASQTIKALEAKGFLVRRRSDHDGRSVRFDVTEAGRAALGGDPLGDLSAALAQLGAPTRAALHGALATLAATLARQRETPAFGTCRGCSYFHGSTGRGYCACLAADLPPEEIGRLCINFAPATAVADGTIPTGKGDPT